jgi:hypothetical protein
MGIAFMLQYLDKAALAASTLLGLLDPTTGGIVSLCLHLKRHFYNKYTNETNSINSI